ncbi:hypothetical protein [Sorangium sp. So ce1099]|uniref:hypothetical protein n=1 Tax=Sorangium sp. So ce1099 TaxID=3133331 RepID=UPI003F61DABC
MRSSRSSSPPEQQREIVGRLLESERYWTRLIEERRARPRDDLLSDLVKASQEEEPRVPLLQLINACAVLVLAGHETTTNLLGLCVYRLLSLPDQLRLVREDPANIPRAVEETLRADTSVQALLRAGSTAPDRSPPAPQAGYLAIFRILPSPAQ